MYYKIWYDSDKPGLIPKGMDSYCGLDKGVWPEHREAVALLDAEEIKYGVAVLPGVGVKRYCGAEITFYDLNKDAREGKEFEIALRKFVGADDE